jgi:hypothetical protein
MKRGHYVNSYVSNNKKENKNKKQLHVIYILTFSMSSNYNFNWGPERIRNMPS